MQTTPTILLTTPTFMATYQEFRAALAGTLACSELEVEDAAIRFALGRDVERSKRIDDLVAELERVTRDSIDARSRVFAFALRASERASTKTVPLP